jgi:hypothetical protein
MVTGRVAVGVRVEVAFKVGVAVSVTVPEMIGMDVRETGTVADTVAVGVTDAETTPGLGVVLCKTSVGLAAVRVGVLVTAKAAATTLSA